MSSFKDKLKDLIKQQITSSTGTTNSSKYRLGTVSLLNDNNLALEEVASNKNGTCMVSVDGISINAFPLYPVVVGQEVVLIFGDAGKISAVPTRPSTPQIDIIPPPFFSGGKLRFVIDETQNIAPLTSVILRFQDQGSRSLFRFIIPDITGNNLANVVKFSKNARLFAVLSEDFGSPNSDTWLKSFSLGQSLTSSGDIDKENKIFSINPAALQAIKPVINFLSGNEQIVDCDIDNDGTLYYLRFRTTVSQSELPAIPNQFTNRVWGIDDGTIPGATSAPLQGTALIHGGSAIGWVSSIFRVGLVGFNSQASYSISTSAPWLTFDLPTRIARVDTTGLGLAAGQYTANLTIISTIPPIPGNPGSGGTFTDVFEFYLFVGPADKDEYTLFKVTKDKNATVSTVTATSVLTTNLHLYTDNRFITPSGFGLCFLDAKTNLVVGFNGDTRKFDVIDMSAGSTPIFSISIVGGESVLSKAANILSFLFTSISPDSVSLFKTAFSKDGLKFTLLPFTNSAGDLNLVGNAPNQAFLLSDSSGFIIDGIFKVRKLKVPPSNGVITADEKGVVGITPPINPQDTTTDTTKVRTIASDTSGQMGFVSVTACGFVI